MLQTMKMEEDERGMNAGHGAFIFFFVLASRLPMLCMALISVKAIKT